MTAIPTTVLRHANLDAIEAAQAQAKTPSVLAFLAHMKAVHPLDRLPSRAAFDPTALPSILPDIVLVSVEWPEDGTGPRFLVKVAGENVRNALTYPLMGQYIDQHAVIGDSTPPYPVLDRKQVVETGCLMFRRGQPRIRFKLDFADVEYCHFPLAADGVTVDHIVTVFIYEANSRQKFGK